MSENAIFEVFTEKSKEYNLDGTDVFIGSKSTTVAEYSTKQDVSFNLSERKNYQVFKYAVKWIPYHKSSFVCPDDEDIYIVWPIEESKCKALTFLASDFRRYYKCSGLQTIHKKSNRAEYDVWLFKKKYIDEFFQKVIMKDFHVPVTSEEINSPYETTYMEGGKIYTLGAYFERDTALRNAAIDKFKNEHNGELFCSICGFDFSKKYGDYGSGYIEVHHIKPLSEDERGEHQADPADLICVCSNCHRMLHHKKPAITTEELKELIQKKVISVLDGLDKYDCRY